MISSDRFYNRLFELISQEDEEGFLDTARGVELENIKTEDGMDDTLLHWAAYFGCNNVVNYLLSQGFNVNERNYEERTPLHEAAIRNKSLVVIELLGNGANINAKDCEGDTPLDLAFHEECNWSFETLINNGAKNPKGYSLREEYKISKCLPYTTNTVQHFGYNVTA